MKRALSLIATCTLCMFLTLLFAKALYASFGGDPHLYAMTTAIAGVAFSVVACGWI